MLATKESTEARTLIREVLLDALQALREEDLGPVIDQIRPIDAWGIASAEGVDLGLELENRLGCSIPAAQNPLVDDKRRRARTIGEMVDWLSTFVTENEVVRDHG